VTAHRVMATSGSEFELVLDNDGRLDDVVGPWPVEDGAEFELEGPLPAHANLDDAPGHIQAYATERGRDVCFYDPDECRTCFCDATGRMYCRKMC